MKDQERKIISFSKVAEKAFKNLSCLKKIGDSDEVPRGPLNIDAFSNAAFITLDIKPLVEKYFLMSESTLVLHSTRRFLQFDSGRDALVFTGDKKYVRKYGPALRIIVENNGRIQRHINIIPISASGLVLYHEEGSGHMEWLANQTRASLIEKFQNHIKI